MLFRSREDMIETGREDLTKELRREGLPVQRMWAGDALVAETEAASYSDLDSLLAAIGEGHISARSLAQKLSRRVNHAESEEQLPSSRMPTGNPNRHRNSVGVVVEGLDDVLVRLSRCCTPVPGDEIIGFITRGRGVSVHRLDCANAESLMAEQAARLIDVEWDSDDSRAMFRAAVEVVALDRSKLLRDVANSLSEQHVNIVSCSTHTGSDRVAKMRFEFEMGEASHLEAVLRTIKQIDSVYDAYRIVPGRG